MVALNFTNLPTVGDLFGRWVWDGVKWKLANEVLRYVEEAPSDSTTYGRENAAWKSIPTITVAASAPTLPATGDVWIDTT